MVQNMRFTKRRVEILDDWVERYDIVDYHSLLYPDKIIVIGLGKDKMTYKKVIR